MADERPLPPSVRKRQEAREQGRVARSGDLAGAAVLLGGCVLLRFGGARIAAALEELASGTLRGLGAADGAWGHGPALARVGLELAPVALGIAGIAVAINALQVGLVLTGAPLAPDASRLDPVAGLGRVLSARGALRGVAALLKGAAIAAVLVLSLRSELARLPGLAEARVTEVAAAWAALLASVGLKGAAALLVLGILDYGYQRWQFERDLSMTREEAVEELKLLEGDPQVRERRRRARRQTAVQGMVAAVGQATAVLTAPDGTAVALRVVDDAGALCLAAKGSGLLCERILAQARAAGVPVVEAAGLAHALYRRVAAGGRVPAADYRAVAAALAPVFAPRGRGPQPRSDAANA